jgi:hypothetical protein
MKGKRRTIDDWKNAAIGAVKELSGQARTDKEIKKSLRDNISSAWGRRPNTTEVNKLREMLTTAGVIQALPKNPVKIGKWASAADIVAYEIIPEKVSGIGEAKTKEEPQEQEKVTPTAKKELKFRMSIQKGGMTEGSLWHNGEVLKSFKDFTVIQFVLNQETQDDSRRFGEAIEELRDKKIGYSFDQKTNPGVIRIVERLMAL